MMNTSLPNLRESLSPGYARMSDQQLKSKLGERYIDAEAMEGFFDDLGKFAASAGKTILKAAPSVLPIAGTVLGTAIGGPVGASLGGTLGKLAGGAIGAATSGGGGAAAGQLLQTITNPATLQALGSMALGPMGKPNVAVGGTPVPISAFTNLLGVLAGKAEAEYNASVAQRGIPEYMTDYAGEAKKDPAVATNRAEALFELLEFDAAQESAEGAESGEFESMEREMEAFQAEWDAMELQEIEAMELQEAEAEEY